MPIQPMRTSPLLVERDAELRVIESVLAEVARGSCRVLLISGDPGVGKSRLARAVVRLGSERGFDVLSGQCSEHDQDFPFAPFVDALRQSLVSVPDPVGFLGSQARALIELLPEYEDAEPASTGPDGISPEQRKRRLFEAVVGFLRQRTALGPHILVLEDVHWADATSFELLELLPLRLASEPLLILGTCRGAEVSDEGKRSLMSLHRKRSLQEIALLPLSREGVGEVLRAMLPASPPQELILAVSTRTGGNPFLVEEMVAAGYTAGAWLRLRFPVPSPIRDIVHQQMEGLDEDTLRVLHVAAVAGERVGFNLLIRLSGLERELLLSRLRELVDRGIVVERWDEARPTIQFRHALIRDAVLDRLLLPERQELHRLVADALEADASRAPPPGVLGMLGYHFHVSGEWDKALHYASRAGQSALDVHASAEALAHFQRALDAAIALDHPDRARLEIRCGAGFALLGEFDTARHHLEQGLDRAAQDGDGLVTLEATNALAGLFASRDYATARTYAERAVELARAGSDLMWEARALNRLGNVLTNQMQFAEGRSLHEEALRIVERVRDDWGSADALDHIGMSHYLSGNVQEARSAFGRASMIFLQVGDLERAASALTSRGLYLAVLDGACVTDASPAAARQDAERGLRTCRDIGWRAGEAYALVALASADLGEGRIDDAQRHVDAALAIARDIDHSQWMVIGLFLRGMLHAWTLDDEHALDHLTRAREIAKQIGSIQWVDRLDAWIARCDPGAPVAIRSRVPDGPLSTIGRRRRLLTRIEHALDHGWREEAHSLTGRFRSSDGTFPAAEPALLHAMALAGMESRDEADAAFEDARRLVLGYGPRALLWRVAAGRSQLWHEVDSRIAGFEAGSARALIEELAATIPDDAWRARFLASPSVQPWIAPAGRQRTRMTSSPGGLTAREMEVAACVAMGMSNKEIAQHLSISGKTVEMHVGGCLSKLGFPSRARLAVWAVEQGLVSPPGRRDDTGTLS
jgi:DNA-binding CsgD family transcriptional regulator/tetratricopeptide (TPR) repeat protein